MNIHVKQLHRIDEEAGNSGSVRGRFSDMAIQGHTTQGRQTTATP